MALKRNERYQGRFLNPTPTHPQGAFKNRTSPVSRDGSYLEADWANDWSGFFERILTVAGVTANGNVDDALSSQYFDAMLTAVASALGTAASRNVGNGSLQIPDMSFFTTGSTWLKLPNGKILQFSQFSTTTAGNTIITFPIPFPSVCRSVVVTQQDTTLPNIIGSIPISNTQFRTTTWSYNGGAVSATSVSYIAVGE